MHFKVKASFIGESHHLFENESDIFDEERVNKRIDNFTMFVSGMLV